MAKLKIKKGDSVFVIAGEYRSEKDRFQVITVDPKTNKATLEGVTVKKHSKPTSKHPQGGIIDVPVNIHISNLMLAGPDGKPTRVGRKADEKSGKLVRFAKSNGEVIK